MPGIGDLAVRLAELGEAEGRLAKRHTVRLAVALLSLVVTFAMLLVGLIFLVFALYYTLRLAVARPGALAIMGGGVVILACIGMVGAKRICASRGPMRKPVKGKTNAKTNV